MLILFFAEINICTTMVYIFFGNIIFIILIKLMYNLFRLNFEPDKLFTVYLKKHAKFGKYCKIRLENTVK